MGFKITNGELDLFLRYAEGNLAVFFLLIAIRCTEQGGPGKEMGILNKQCKTLDAQVRWARNTVLSKERIYLDAQGKPARSDTTHLFTDEFLVFFSSKYAPIGAKNDPQGLNENHLKNLRFYHSRCRSVLGEVV